MNEYDRKLLVVCATMLTITVVMGFVTIKKLSKNNSHE